MDSSAAQRQDIYSRAVSYIAAALPGLAAQSSQVQASARPLLISPSGAPLSPAPLTPDSRYSFGRQAAKREGSMKNWIPRRLFDRQAEAAERERIVERATDLTNSDPHGAGMVDYFATTVVGAGLAPHPVIDPDAVGLSKDETRALQARQRAVYNTWAPFADAGQRMHFGAIVHLWERNLIQYGEYLTLVHMIDDPGRPYYLALKVINPLRLKTPVDLLTRSDIADGVELGAYGEPVAYWIKKSVSLGGRVVGLSDVSANFIRVPARQGHRWNVLHGFIAREPEQVRGWSFFAPMMKMFRDLNDLLDAELVSSIVTAAFSMAIELLPSNNPFEQATRLSGFTEYGTKPDGSTERTRYQELIPGSIMYLNAGEKANPIAAARPGVTFDPFVKIVKNAMAYGAGLPRAIMFRDADGLNFAAWRGQMLDAWRTITFHRQLLGQGDCARIWTMLQEEAYLRGELEVTDFYTRMHALTRCEWRGSPKGDVEPVKAAQADILLVRNNLKTRTEAIIERGGDVTATFDQLEEEQEMMEERGLTESAIQEKAPGAATAPTAAPPEEEEEES